MGTASSVPEVGVPVNPRLQYADELAKKGRQDVVIDAPILMDLGHGTVRYRYVKNAGQGSDAGSRPKQDAKAAGEGSVENRTEAPHEGPERHRKHGYFYHAKLDDFSEDADDKKEDSFKFRYVFKGPTGAKKKKMFYVFGEGLNGTAKDGGLVKRPDQDPGTKTQGKGYVWPETFRKENHSYYDLTFSKQNGELSEDEDEADDMEVAAEKTIHQKTIELKVRQSDTLLKVKERLAFRLLRSVGHIHVTCQGQELQNDDTVREIRAPLGLDDGSWDRVQIRLRAM